MFVGGVGLDSWTTILSDEDPSDYFIGVLSYNGSDVELRVDGEEEYASSQSGEVSTSETYSVGAYNDAGTPTYFADADIASVLVYDRALSASERQRVEAYFQHIYSLAP